MSAIVKKERLNTRHKVGHTFFHTTKKHIYMKGKRIPYLRYGDDYEVMKDGSDLYVVKDKRKYLVRILYLAETRAGRHYGGDVRYWQFVYRVQIIQN